MYASGIPRRLAPSRHVDASYALRRHGNRTPRTRIRVHGPRTEWVYCCNNGRLAKTAYTACYRTTTMRGRRLCRATYTVDTTSPAANDYKRSRRRGLFGVTTGANAAARTYTRTHARRHARAHATGRRWLNISSRFGELEAIIRRVSAVVFYSLRRYSTQVNAWRVDDSNRLSYFTASTA